MKAWRVSKYSALPSGIAVLWLCGQKSKNRAIFLLATSWSPPLSFLSHLVAYSLSVLSSQEILPQTLQNTLPGPMLYKWDKRGPSVLFLVCWFPMAGSDLNSKVHWMSNSVCISICFKHHSKHSEAQGVQLACFTSPWNCPEIFSSEGSLGSIFGAPDPLQGWW